MTKMLYIKASPRGEQSFSTRAGEAFVQKYTETNPDDQVDTLDLFEEKLPAFNGLTLSAKYRILHGEEATEDEKKAWRQVEEIIERFKSADKYLFSLPMWNFGISYRLKHYIDILVQPTYTFSVTENGYEGIVTGKPAALVYARGGDYPPDSPVDYQKKYMETILGFIGFAEFKSVIVQPTLAGGPDTAKQKLQEATEKARQLAAEF